MDAVGTYSEPWSSKKLLNNKRDFQIFWRRGWDSNLLFKPHTHRGRPVFSESRYGACNLPRQSAFALIQATMNLLLSFRIIGYINNINCMVTSPVAYSAVSLLQRRQHLETDFKHRQNFRIE